MKLTLDEIDPTLVQKMRTRIAEFKAQNWQSDQREPLYITLRNQVSAMQGLKSLTGATVAVTIALSSWLCQLFPDQAPLPYGLVLTSIPLYFVLRDRITKNTEPRLWRAFIQGNDFSRVERAYLEALSAVERADAELGRPFLQCLNELIVAGRGIEKKLSELRKYHKEVTVESLTQELENLEQRAAAASSPEAAQTLRQSAAICAQRLESRRAISQVEERLSAQVEAICQTIASVSGTLAQVHIAPLSQNTPELQQLTQTVAEITLQTRATEAAVQEVLAVGRS